MKEEQTGIKKRTMKKEGDELWKRKEKNRQCERKNNKATWTKERKKRKKKEEVEERMEGGEALVAWLPKIWSCTYGASIDFDRLPRSEFARM